MAKKIKFEKIISIAKSIRIRLRKWYANMPDIEVYFEKERQGDHYVCEVWIPITKK